MATQDGTLPPLSPHARSFLEQRAKQAKAAAAGNRLRPKLEAAVKERLKTPEGRAAYEELRRRIMNPSPRRARTQRTRDTHTRCIVLI